MAQITAFAGNKEHRFPNANAQRTPEPVDVPAPSAAAQSITTLEQPLQLAITSDDEVEPKPNKKRKKAKAFGLLLLVGLGSTIAWYPLSDHHAPYAGGASITADVTQISARVAGPVTEVLIKDNAEVTAGQTLFQIDQTTYQMDVEQATAQLAQC